jgi:hypothetical protein
VKMRIKAQVASESVRHDHDHHANAMFELYPLLYDSGSERRKVMEKAPILLEQWPEDIWHCQADACIRCIRQGGPLFELP